jgi:hypothetical protein
LANFSQAEANEGTVHQQIHFESFLQERWLNQNGFSPRDHLYEGFFLADDAWSWTRQNLFFEIKPQIRGVQSPGVSATGLAKATAATTPRWFNTQRLLGRDQDQEMYLDLDRLNARYSFTIAEANGEIYLGRRPLSLGVLRLFPIWNKLTLPLIFQPGPEWIENADGYGAKVQIQQLGVRTFAVRGTNPHEDSIYLAELKYSEGTVETQILLADWWKRAAIGIAATTDFLGASWRLEALNFSRERGSPMASAVEQNQWGLGIERAIGARWVVDLEYLQQSLCSDFKSGYGNSAPTRLQALNGCRYLFPYIDYQMTSLLHFGGGLLVNLDNPSGMGIISSEYSLYESLSVQLKGKWAFGKDQSEFGSARYLDPYGRTAGVQSTLYLGFTYTN